MNDIAIGLLGVGTVGSGVLRVLHNKSRRISQALGAHAVVRRCLVQDLEKQRNVPQSNDFFTTNPDEVLDDPTIQIIVELMGGEEPARTYMERALKAGKHVVTASKEVISKHGVDLLRTAESNGVNLFYEASVGGGIPIIRVLRRDLVVNEISHIQAIINGTTNYILTDIEQGHTYAEALHQAQALGYAEPDPRNDVEGIDASYKLAILASLAFRSTVHPSDIHCTGITKLDIADFRYAEEMGYVIKLIASARLVDGQIEAAVIPTMLPRDHHLASVKGVFNAVLIDGDEIDQLMLYGRGAGAKPTSSAILADVCAAIRDIVTGVAEHVEFPAHARPIRDFGETESRFCMRILVADKPGVLAKIAHILGENDISIASCIQKESDAAAKVAVLVIMTHPAIQKQMTQALDEIGALPMTREIQAVLRVAR